MLASVYRLAGRPQTPTLNIKNQDSTRTFRVPIRHLILCHGAPTSYLPGRGRPVPCLAPSSSAIQAKHYDDDPPATGILLKRALTCPIPSQLRAGFPDRILRTDTTSSCLHAHPLSKVGFPFFFFYFASGQTNMHLAKSPLKSPSRSFARRGCCSWSYFPSCLARKSGATHCKLTSTFCPRGVSGRASKKRFTSGASISNFVIHRPQCCRRAKTIHTQRPGGKLGFVSPPFV